MEKLPLSGAHQDLSLSSTSIEMTFLSSPVELIHFFDQKQTSFYYLSIFLKYITYISSVHTRAIVAFNRTLLLVNSHHRSFNASLALSLSLTLFLSLKVAELETLGGSHTGIVINRRGGFSLSFLFHIATAIEGTGLFLFLSFRTVW